MLLSASSLSPSRPAPRVAACLLAAALSACGTGDAAQPPRFEPAAWSAPSVEVRAGAFHSPRSRVEDVAAEPGGAVHAVFLDTNGPVRGWNRVLYARLDADGAAPAALDDTPGRSQAPRVAVDGNGTVHVVWWEAVDPRMPDAGTHLLHRAAGAAGWSPADTLYRETDPAGLRDLQAALAADGRGRLHLLHSRASGGLGYLVLEGGRWRAGADPRLPGGYLRWDRGAARRGRLEMAYVAAQVTDQVRESNNDLWFRTLDGGGWSEPAAVHVAPTRSHDPALLTDARGVRHAVWVESGARGRAERLLHATSRDGVRWSAAAEITTPAPDADYYAPRLGLDARGRLHLVYLRGDAAAVVPQQTRLEADGWAPAAPLSADAVSDALELELASDGAGTLHAVWKGRDGAYRRSRLGP